MKDSNLLVAKDKITFIVKYIRVKKAGGMKDTQNDTIQIKRLSHNNDFYSNVFKRIEKLVSVVFYMLSHIDIKYNNETHIERIKDTALHTHEQSLRTLELQEQDVSTGLETLQYELLRLDSTLRVANSANVIPQPVFNLLTEQIDSIQRYVNNHFTHNSSFSYANDEQTLPGLDSASKTGKAKKSTTATRPKKVQIPEGDISSDAYLVYSQLTDRAERIKTVLEAKPKASIKDIAEVITDVSEKTIQRELNSLIEKGQVVREGERRWSRYSVAD